MTVKTTAARIVSWLAEKRLLGAAILGISFLVAAVIIVTGPEAEPQARTEKAWPVSVVKAEPAKLAPTLVAYGKVESRQMANLKTSISAPIAEVISQEGTWVEKGEVLIRMDTRELELSVRSAESEYKRRLAVLVAVKNDYASERRMTEHHRELKEIAEAKLKRHKELYASRMISDAILDEVRQQASERAITLEKHLARIANFPSLIEQDEAMVAEAKSILEKAKLDLEQAEIRAPFAGRVIKTFVAPGDRILPGTPLVQVADYSELEVRASIPANTGYGLRQRIREGVKVTAVAMLDGQKIVFVLDRLSGDVKPGQSGLDVFFSCEDGVNLDIGRIVDLTITLPPENDVVALPIQSIYENDRIYKVENDRLVGMRVKQVGEYLDGEGNFKVLVRSPAIKEGDRLITTQLPRAITGLLVEPIDASKFDEALAADRSAGDKSG